LEDEVDGGEQIEEIGDDIGANGDCGEMVCLDFGKIECIETG
jgi:hypothetical protein